MIFIWGDFRIPDTSATVVIDRVNEFNSFGKLTSITETWTVAAKLTAESYEEFYDRIKQLEAMASYRGRDAILLTPDGHNTAHRLISAQCEGGTRIGKLSYPEKSSAEYVPGSYRSFSLTVTGKRIYSSNDDATPGQPPQPLNEDIEESFSETVTWEGGGPRYIWQESCEGMPIKYLVANHTLYKATQSGKAVGRGEYPSIPQPLWPSKQMGNPKISKRPERVGADGAIKCEITWEYNFVSSSTLQGDPHQEA